MFQARNLLPLLFLVLVGACATTPTYEKPGFVAEMVDGRLWVFEEGSPELEEFRRVGEPAKSVTLVGEGPEGVTLRGPDRETLRRYLGA